MTDTVIQVDGLGKRYLLGQARNGGGYRTLRESLVDAVQSPFRRWRAPAAAEASVEEFWALRDVSFDVKRGEIVGIVGRNGAGKSTLLKVLSRITEPTHGTIRLQGRVASLLEVGTGFHPELTGRENIFLNGAILGMHRQEIKAKFDEIVAFAEVERFLDTPVKRYSSGMYVRLAFAVAAHLEPEILIVDEVLAVGDAEFQKKCLGKMQEVAGTGGRTVFFVSHNMAAVHQLCTRAMLLQRGTLVQTGSPLEVIDTYLHSAATTGFNGGKRLEESIWLTDARLLDPAGDAATNFTHREPVRVAFDFTAVRAVAGANLCMNLKDSKDRIVFRSEVDLPAMPGSLSPACPLQGHAEAVIPGDLLTPGRYALTFYFHVPVVRTLYLAEDALVFTVIDAGSRFAAYEGKADIGSVFVDCAWRIGFSEQSFPEPLASSLHG